mmetsp:Transcript_4923/g.20068  ORF Transcript_4923/g.20068 Transcript_4923/m.20068 type:complete len:238 (-) Transcript_4923:2331-3044(-)
MSPSSRCLNCRSTSDDTAERRASSTSSFSRAISSREALSCDSACLTLFSAADCASTARASASSRLCPSSVRIWSICPSNSARVSITCAFAFSTASSAAAARPASLVLSNSAARSAAAAFSTRDCCCASLLETAAWSASARDSAAVRSCSARWSLRTFSSLLDASECSSVCLARSAFSNISAYWSRSRFAAEAKPAFVETSLSCSPMSRTVSSRSAKVISSRATARVWRFSADIAAMS